MNSTLPPPARERVTQFTIARALWLSKATVSNALNRKPERCSLVEYARIWEYAREVGYVTAPVRGAGSGGWRRDVA
jgi:DNA-binding LacI/PurR family transcriptional regulator